MRFALTATLFVALSAFSARADDVVPLPSLGADITQTSVSGLSSGAFMAAQFNVAFSQNMVGAGIVAGGPYYCANGLPLMGASTRCMFSLAPVDVAPSIAMAKQQAAAGNIDPLSNLARQKVYLFHGSLDFVVYESALTGVQSFYTDPSIAVPAANIVYHDKTTPAGHAFITQDDGSMCSFTFPPYVNACQLDQAGDILQWIYGGLKPRVDDTTGSLIAFNQMSFMDDGQSHGMAATGYVYVPKACAAGTGAHCRVHVVFHGCGQNAETVDDAVFGEVGAGGDDGVGYNNWADNNNLIVLYPQTTTTATNMGCWDWYGYDDANYYTKNGHQMKAVNAMVKQLSGTPAP